MKLTITRQKIDNTDKEGNELISKKSGKPYYKVGIQTQEHGSMWLNGLLNFRPEWQGTQQELEIYDEEYNGKTYKKFRLPKRDTGTSPEKFGTSAAEIKNMIDLKVMPILEQHKAAIAEVKFLIQALGDRLEKVLKGNDDEMSNFDRAVDGEDDQI